ncbi:LAFE_0G02894g1_1 [Lachancea fermentati]|uniref:LAFE_0G02894g1_1 n=1 Tax=Lachancea fermentati TaxID=4955 RepID=A0A1G4MH96_LACFM|nr:LAFE_0G02894g1_1 [Lachancea fermentati]
MASEHDEFVATLESFKDLKSGISGSRIKKLTSYALEHVDDEETLMQMIINYSKHCPDTHKLGSLYIIDSIGRAYLDQARARDDYIKSSAKKGSCAHGVYTLGDSIQELLGDAILKSNDDHKDKIRTLIDIWDRSGLFQKGYLNAVRAKYFSMDVPGISSSAPVKSLSQDPKERCLQILKNFQPNQNVPQVSIPAGMLSDELAAQQSALLQFLVSLQQCAASTNVIGVQSARSQESQQSSQIAPTLQQSRGDRRERYGTTSSKRGRSRSPPRREHHKSEGPSAANNHHLYPDEENVPSNPHFRPKPVSFDPTVPPDNIKVYSRTLFVGGVPPAMKEYDIAAVLRPYGEVQSVILNSSRKHAFVKVYSRQEAENVLNNFNKDGSSPLRTRWGVGFGPRDCCDYQHGYSIIPLHRLTDADKKWSVSAQWGGTGGQPLQATMVFEEPDIVVGEGVSSKAISQKMPTDSGRNGPKSGKPTRSSNFRQSPNQNQFYGQMNMTPVPVQQQYPPVYSGSPPIQSYAMPNVPQQQMPPIYDSGVASQSQSPAQSQFDPTAQLNSLMSMLNQQK